jgi:hypothetical protein
MAGRPLNRRELRKQADEAERAEVVAEAPAAEATLPKKKPGNAPEASKVKKARKPKAPLRMRARWAVYDTTMKQVAIFDYNQRAAAEEKVADLIAKKKVAHFLQITKEPIIEPAPAAP